MALPVTTPTNGRGRLRRGLHALSLALDRYNMRTQAGLTYGTDRDLYATLGSKTKLEPKDYRERYERGGITERIVEAYPGGTWSGGATIVEDPKPDVDTPFELAVVELFKRLDVWSIVQRADILAGLGRYSVLLIGEAGKLNTELKRVTSADKVLYLTPYSEEFAKIEKSVSSTSDPRFGLPELYTLTFGDTKLNRKVHHSRVIHVAEGLLTNDVMGKPRLRAVWNYLDDLEKIVGGGSEAAWKRADPGIQADLDPDVEMDTDDEAALEDEIDEYMHGLRRFMRTRGVNLNMLQTQVAAFGGNATAVLQLISATTGIPHRILTGSERGELASTQDRNNWNDRITERRRDFAIPLVSALIDKLIAINALPEPSEYEVTWPEIEELDESEKATVTATLAGANQKQKAAEGVIIVTGNEIRESVLGLEPLAEVVDDADDALPEDDEDPDEIDTDDTDDTTDMRADRDPSEIGAVQRVADKHRLKVARSFVSHWDEVAEVLGEKKN